MEKTDLSPLIKDLQKTLGGAAVVQNINEIIIPFNDRLPTGIASLDRALKGGFPSASMNQVHGPDGVGKDYLTNCVIAQAQKRHGSSTNIAWMSFGYRPDVHFMRMAGVDPSVGNVVVVDIKEAAKDNPAEVLLSGMLKLIRSNKFQLVIINELLSGETRDEV